MSEKLANMGEEPQTTRLQLGMEKLLQVRNFFLEFWNKILLKSISQLRRGIESEKLQLMETGN